MLTVSQLPPNDELLKPVQLVGGWEHPRHPNISQLQRDAEIIVTTLNFLSRIACVKLQHLEMATNACKWAVLTWALLLVAVVILEVLLPHLA